MADSQNVPNIHDIVNNTNILAIINQVLGLNDATNEFIRYLKVSILLILKFIKLIVINTNIA